MASTTFSNRLKLGSGCRFGLYWTSYACECNSSKSKLKKIKRNFFSKRKVKKVESSFLDFFSKGGFKVVKVIVKELVEVEVEVLVVIVVIEVVGVVGVVVVEIVE